MKKPLNILLTCTFSVLLISACSDNDDDVAPVDTVAPTISVADQEILADMLAQRIAISITDNMSVTANLQISATSTEQNVISDDDLTLTNDGNELILSVSPQRDTVGRSMIMVSATDEAQNTSSQSFNVDVLANGVSATEFINVLSETGADQDPSFINGIEIIQDIESDELFDELFLK